MIKRTYPFTLVEILVALCLFALLSSVLFSSFKSASFLSNRLSFARERILEHQHVHQRLLPLFNHTRFSSLSTNIEKDNPYLLFSFHSQVDPQPAFSGFLHARLYVNHLSELILEIAPSAKSNQATRKEILMTNIQSCQWHLTPPRILTLQLTDTKEQNFEYAFFLETNHVPLITMP